MVEILVVIALLGLVTAVVAVRFDVLVPALREPSAEASVRKAFALAAHEAQTQKRTFFVRLDEENFRLNVEDSDGNAVQNFSLRRDAGNRIPLRFRADPRDGTKLFVPASLAEIDAAEFHPAGCSTPTVVEILKNGKTEKLLQSDPFSGGLFERNKL